MRLKEIEERLAAIKNELTTRAAELKEEEITALENEVTALQEERAAIKAAAEKRSALLARIAAGESVGDGEGDGSGQQRVLRNFKGAAGEGDNDDKYGSMEYRKAFMKYVCSSNRRVRKRVQAMAADTTTLTEKMRAALRISSTSEKITEEINDCIAACKMDLQDVGVKKLEETDALIIRAITLYCKAEFGYSDKSEQFWKSYECLKMHLSLSSEYTGGVTPDTADDEVGEQDIKNLFGQEK